MRDDIKKMLLIVTWRVAVCSMWTHRQPHKTEKKKSKSKPKRKNWKTKMPHVHTYSYVKKPETTTWIYCKRGNFFFAFLKFRCVTWTDPQAAKTMASTWPAAGSVFDAARGLQGCTRLREERAGAWCKKKKKHRKEKQKVDVFLTPYYTPPVKKSTEYLLYFGKRGKKKT